MNRKRWPNLVIAAAWALLLLGCPQEGDTITYVVGPSAENRFPGAPTVRNNLAVDGCGFTEPLNGFQGLAIFPDAALGTAIVLTKTQTSTGRRVLWASFFDGSSFTRPVELLGALVDPQQDFQLGLATVVWIRTAEQPASAGGERNGDAVILFRRLETTAGTDNQRLYAAYFDRTYAATPIHPADSTVRFGFHTHGVLVDTDTGYDVTVLGLLSDSYLMNFGSVRFDTSGNSGFLPSGNDTHFVAAFWKKPNPAGGETLYTAAFDLSNANTDDAFSAETAYAPAAGSSYDGDDDLGDGFEVHENALLYQVANNEAASPDHRLLEVAFWTVPDGPLANPVILSRQDPDQIVTGDMPDFTAGPAHGLARLYVLGRESGFEDSVTGSSGVNDDTDLMLHIVDPATASVETAEIDGIAGAWNDAGSLDVSSVDAVLSRDGSWIAVGWLQDFSAAEPTACLRSQAVQTIPEGGVTRSLADSVTGAVVMNNDTASASDYADVVAWSFQENLLYRLGHQSDLTRVNALFVQEPDSGDTDNLQLRTAYLAVTLDTTGAAAPQVAAGAGASSDTLVWEGDTDHPDWGSGSEILGSAAALDAGSGGNVHVYFLADGDGNPLVETAGDPAERRAFRWDGATATEIGSDNPATGISTLGFVDGREAREIRVFQGPFVSGRTAYAGRYHYIFLLEAREAPGSTDALRFRLFDTAAAPGPAAYHPALGLQPDSLDTGEPHDVVMDLSVPPLLGSTAGVVFRQGGHVYYNQGAPGESWYLRDGLPDPALVDDFDPGYTFAHGTFPSLRLPREDGVTIDFLSRTMIFFIKADGAGTARLRVRTRY